jgi:cell wall-associated protease
MKVQILLISILLSFQNLLAQQKDIHFNSESWYLKDPKTDKTQGVSVEKVYSKILKDKPSKTVVVAIIDSGVDIDHEDLKEHIWTNDNEIPDNGIDDDGNGYIDDIHGWNFLGGKDGNVVYEALELSRIYKDLKPKYSSNTLAHDTTTAEYALWQEVSDRYRTESNLYSEQHAYYQKLQLNFEWYSQLLKSRLKTDSLTIVDIENIVTVDSTENKGIHFMTLINDYYGSIAGFEEYIKYFENKLNNYDIESDLRAVVGDNLNDLYEKGYGNNDVKGPDSRHGTHVSGIVGAIRDNNLGINGIAANVKIMSVRAVPDGDERDKDVANAILYAVDNGAKIINMSFGKFYSPQKEAVDKAVKYAESKGVLMVHGAGNESMDIDQYTHYPSRILADNTRISSWMEVGATSWDDNKNFVAEFSNYGHRDVDIFAPGVQIYSTTPGNNYEAFDGTSMAAPVITGVAAMLMSYYPELTTLQIKDIIKKSAKTFDNLKVIRPGTENDKVKFSELSETGGLVNAFEAVKMAESMSIKVRK